MNRPEHPGMIYRELGTTGERVSAIGLGGFHLAKDPNTTQQDAVRLVRSAVDQGITFLDNCWDYNDGISEVRMGQALKDGYRQKVFLMTKLDARTYKDYNKQLEQSMGRLDTDVIDLVQFHEILRFEDPDRIFAEDGAIHAAMEARKAGKIRYIGFTGHKNPQIHLQMFEIAEQHGFKFDTVQMPVNAMDAHFRSFTKNVIPVAQKAGTGVLAMKTFGDGYILKSGTIDPVQALHYGLSVPGVSVVITGIDKPEILTQALNAAKTFQPFTAEQTQAFLSKTQQAAMTGKFEPFKTTNIFDGTAQNPKWLGGESGSDIKPSSPEEEQKRVAKPTPSAA
ncbi:MAG TPA: aldo/keto reductase [Acidobacteriaceae bacterium]|nr:aldo/keto reductase [Acidobacteriaceae bacterium]